LSEEEERELCKQIREQYIEPGFYCPPKVAQVLARRIHGAPVPEKWAWDHDESSEDGEGMEMKLEQEYPERSGRNHARASLLNAGGHPSLKGMTSPCDALT
jgi:hypothetical protein